MQSITKSIWQTLGQALDIRAVYLKNICKQFGLPLQGQRYLDIGAGARVNSLVFGKDFTTTYCIDLNVSKRYASSHTNLVFALGDAEALPFRDATFDLVSLFSVIEHVKDQEQALCEVFRVLKPGGALVVQIPNRRFPVELHSGLPNPLLCPGFIRRPLLRAINYSRLLDVEIPSRKRMLHLIRSTHAPLLINEAKVVWPAAIVSKVFRGPYKLLTWLGVLRLLPLGYVFTCKKLPPKGLKE
jgi:SAM-dependent methyltransferase